MIRKFCYMFKLLGWLIDSQWTTPCSPAIICNCQQSHAIITLTCVSHLYDPVQNVHAGIVNVTESLCSCEQRGLHRTLKPQPSLIFLFFFYQECDVTDVTTVFCGPFVSFTLHYNVCRQQRKVNAVLCAL